MNAFFLEQKELGIILFELSSGRVTRANPLARKILNQNAHNPVGQSILQIFPALEFTPRSRPAPPQILWEGFLPFVREQVFCLAFSAQQSGVLLLLPIPEPDDQNLHLLPYLRLLIGSVDFENLIVDLNGTIMSCSSHFCRELGYSFAELLGQNMLDLIVPETQRAFWKAIFYTAKTFNEAMPLARVKFLHKSGTPIDFTFNNSLLKANNGQPLGLSLIVTNSVEISKRVRERGKTGKLEGIIARISSMFAQSPTYKLDDCINETLKIVGEYARVDRSYVFLFRDNLKLMDNTHEWCAPGIEPQIFKLQGLPSKMVPWWMKFLLRNEIIHIPQVSALPEEAAVEKEILEAQDIQSLIVVPLTEGENLIGFIGFDSVRRPKFWSNEDINLLKIVSSVFVSSLIRKNTELSLADSERRYRTLFSIAPDLIFILDVQGRIVSLNPAFKKITGFEIESYLKTPFAELIAEKERNLLKEKLETCLQSGTTVSQEFHLSGKKQEKIFDCLFIPFQERGKVSGILGIGRDVTERKTLEESLRQAERLKSIGTLAGGIAHDFNNILEILLGNYTILKNALPENSDVRFSLDLIRQAIERGRNLVQNLLTFASKKQPRYIDLDLNREVKHVVELLQQTIPRTIHFDLQLAPQSLWIRFDQVQIQQMILNVCLNAIDAIKAKKPQGTIKIFTRLASPSEVKAVQPKENNTKQSFALLGIEDDGIGFDAQTQKFLFDPFFTTKSNGTGLGLAVVFGVVKSLNGFIQIESQPGQGSVFKFFLPLTQPQTPVQPTEVTERAQPKQLHGEAHILLVEDDALLSKMLMYILKRFGYTVSQVYSGAEAQKVFQQKHKAFDAVILDYDLPEVNGWTLAQQFLRQNSKIKIILTSGFLELDIKAQILQTPNIKLFEKPYDPEDLLEFLVKFLN